MLNRRSFIGAAAGAAFMLSSAAKAVQKADRRLIDALAEIERGSGGRVGVAMHDTGTNMRFAYRGDERFAFCSTFKFLLAGAMLHRSDRGGDRLDHRLPVAKSDIVTHSPFTQTRVGDSASIAELCHATMTTSDNAAANILMRRMGGPAALQRFVRSLGDRRTRFDRWEPALNTAVAGDPRDTTTPGEMVRNMERLLLGNALSAGARGELLGWMRANTTGDTRIRAGTPAGWLAGDKTGTGENGANNDIAILLPPGRPPILIASYLTENDLASKDANKVHADVTRAVIASLI